MLSLSMMLLVGLGACEDGSNPVAFTDLPEPGAASAEGSDLSDQPASAPSSRTVVVDPDSVSLYIADTLTVSAEEWWPNGRIETDPNVNWRTSDEDIVRVSSEGLLTAVAEGEATVSAARGGRSGDVRVYVSEVPEVEEETSDHEAPEERTIVVTPDVAVVSIDDVFQLSAEEWWPSGSISTDPDVTWSSSDPSVATVASDGTVVGVAEGSATISATRSGRSGYAALTVVASPVEEDDPVAKTEDEGSDGEDPIDSEEDVEEHEAPEERTIVVTPEEAVVSIDDVFQLSAEEWWPSGSISTDPDVTWSSSDPSIASVDSNGTVKALTAGTATVSATRSGRTGSALITVEGGDEYGNGSEEASEDEEYVSPPPSFGGSMVAAFPGAEGYGATALTTCNRENTHVFKVINRNDEGSGSLRQALADAQAAPSRDLKAIVFNVGGYIHTSRQLQFEGECLYIAGQTAPGDGVAIRGRGLEFQRGAKDIVVRFLTVRLGASGGGDGILVRKGQNLVFDHLSISWAPTTLIRFSRTQIGRSGPIQNVTVQRSLLGESLASHPTAFQIGGTPDTDEGSTQAGWKDVTGISVHRNALASNNHRNVNARGLYVEVANNVIHNWNLDGGQTGRGAIVDWINNYAQKGPMSRSDRVPFNLRGQDIDDDTFGPSLYIHGNVSLGGTRHQDQLTDPGVDNNWTAQVEGSRSTSLGLVDWYHNDDLTGVSLEESRRSQPLYSASTGPAVPLTVDDPYRARDSVLESVGANQGLTCRGVWAHRIDGVDYRLLREIRDGTGASSSVSHESEAGGFPHLAQGNACVDSNGDGIPDEWKVRHGLDPHDSSVVSRIGAGGYSYLEHYLNGTAP